MALDRLRKELADITKDTESGVTAFPIMENIQHLKGSIKGPTDSPYDGGVFEVDIVIPDTYPFDPPKMRFTTKVWHPNVSSQTGAICLDILKDNWSPALTVKTALVSLQALLSAPEPDDPQDAEVAAQYKGDNDSWAATAKFWTESYAMPKDLSAQVAQLQSMGFEKEAATKALAEKGGDVEAAMEALLSG